jgi:hypothetical protein
VAGALFLALAGGILPGVEIAEDKPLVPRWDEMRVL